MKRAASILLITLLAFNWVGYRVLTGFIEHESDLALETRIDREEYDESMLMELRVPLNAPYLSGTLSEFERVDGEIEVDGVHYKYVKRKVENGQLVLLCIPNDGKTKIQNSRVDFFKLVNDLNHSTEGKSKNSSASKNFLTEFSQENNSWTIPAYPQTSSVTAICNDSFVNDGFNVIPEQPPRA